jgi:hypothetical protein
MVKNILAILICCSLIGCVKKEVKLPLLGFKGLMEIHNHSQIWFFFDIQNKDTTVVINRNNTISSTHWIYNIDRRLPLKTIIPSIVSLKEKHASGVHSKEGMLNYFSYSDTLSNTLSFLEFDAVNYKTDSLLSTYFIRENNSDYVKYNNINLTFNPKNIWLNDAKLEKTEFRNTLLEFIDFSGDKQQTMLHLNFNQNLLYQDYLYYKTLLLNFDKSSIRSNSIEFIFDPNKVPDCGCE